jgi:hypothetical protein
MRTSGVKLLDPVLEQVQVEWLIVPAEDCRSQQDEELVIRSHFRRPHEPWGGNGAFVMPVRVRRSRRRVLFSQQLGLA